MDNNKNLKNNIFNLLVDLVEQTDSLMQTWSTLVKESNFNHTVKKDFNEINIIREEVNLTQIISTINIEETKLEHLVILSMAAYCQYSLMVFPLTSLLRHLEMKVVFQSIEVSEKMDELERLMKKLLNFKNYNEFYAEYDYEKYSDRLIQLGKEDIIKLTVIFNSKPKQLRLENSHKTLNDFIYKIEDKEGFIKELANTFTTEKGQRIRVIIEVLKLEDILIIEEGDFKNFVFELSRAFGRTIGEYSGIKVANVIDILIKEPIVKKLTPIVNKFKTT